MITDTDQHIKQDMDSKAEFLISLRRSFDNQWKDRYSMDTVRWVFFYKLIYKGYMGDTHRETSYINIPNFYIESSKDEMNEEFDWLLKHFKKDCFDGFDIDII